MNRIVRRSLTAVGTGIALVGAFEAVNAAKPPPVTVASAQGLMSAMGQERQAASRLSSAIRTVRADIARMQAQIRTLEVSVQKARQKVAARPGTITSVGAPIVHARTGASGGDHDDGGGGFGDDGH